MAKKYVSWKSADAFHRGEVLSEVDGRITMLTIEGLEVSYLEPDGVTKVLTRRPKPSRAKVAEVVEPIVEVSVAVKKARKSRDGSKKQRAIELFRAHFKKHGSVPARKEGILMIVEQLGMTPKGAATYWFDARKVINAA